MEINNKKVLLLLPFWGRSFDKFRMTRAKNVKEKGDNGE